MAATAAQKPTIQNNKTFQKLISTAVNNGNVDERKLTKVILEAWKKTYKETGIVPLLPILFRLKGNPYSLIDYPPMEVFFKINDIPREMLVIAGRQVSKSCSLSFQGLSRSIVTPYFNSLFVTPLYEQIKRFSKNYMASAIKDCNLYDVIKEDGTTANVLERALSNGSIMFFSYAFRDCERIRGIPASALFIDEVQGIDHSFVPIMKETLAASDYRLTQYTGTPLTTDNTIEKLWRNSSQAEWTIKCESCNKENIAGIDFQLLKMIGKKGLICAFCGKPINTEYGYWTHINHKVRHIFSGYHTPQSIFPMHCRDPDRWAELIRKMEGKYGEAKFMNECLGVSWDSGSKLVTIQELMDACTLDHRNDRKEALKNFRANDYVTRILAIDWSGGGALEESLTAYVVLGLVPDGRIKVIYMDVKPHRTDHSIDAKMAIDLFNEFHCNFLAHDYTGAGSNRESMLITMGFPSNKIMPFTLHTSHGKRQLVSYNPPTKSNVRSSYMLDKTRSLVYTCELIKNNYILFPKYESCEDYMQHFLALVEETKPTPRSGDLYLIGKSTGVPDDVAQAVNIGICAAYTTQGKFPNLLEYAKNKNTKKALKAADADL